MKASLALLAALVLAPAAQAVPVAYRAHLDGPSESPPVASPGAGTAKVVIDTDAHTMRVQVTFVGLIGLTTVAHIHAPTAVPGEGTVGVATQVPTFEGFPAGVSSGSYDHTFDLENTASFNPSYMTTNGGTAAGAEAALALALAEGRAYLNVHSSFAPGGEIRGFLRPVPEPGSALGLLALAAGAVFGMAKRRPRRPA